MTSYFERKCHVRPIGEFRTTKQIEADRIDLEVYRLLALLDRFANAYGDVDVRRMAAELDGKRERVRKHMHRIDRDVT